MSTRAKQTAMLFGIAIGLAIPTRVPCLVPGAQCELPEVDHRPCTPTDLEPFGVYAIEYFAGRDLPIAYRSWLDCS